MKGTALGNYIARKYADRLMTLTPEQMDSQSHWESDRAAWICRAEICMSRQIRNDQELFTVNSEEQPNCPGCNEPMDRDHHAGQRVDDGRYFYGLTFHDPNYNPGKAVIGKDADDRTFARAAGGSAEGKTVEQAEKDSESFGLERYQAFYRASSKTPTERHTVPRIDGACGLSSVERIMKAIGLDLEYVRGRRNRRDDLYILHDKVLS
jgi:hypothetical protein